MNIVITTLNSWDYPDANIKILAEQFSARHNVLFVNTPLDVFGMVQGFKSVDSCDRVKNIRKTTPIFRQINNRMWIFTPPVAISAPGNIYSEILFDLINRKNNRRLAREIKWAMNQVNMKGEFIHLNDNDIFSGFYMKELLCPKFSIYYRRDNLLSIPYWSRNGVRLEPQLIKKSDAVVTCSETLAASVRPYNYRTFNIGQGADLESIKMQNNQFVIPRDMNGIRGPIIGFIGNLAALYTSANTIHRVAREHPRCSVVLVGQEDRAFASHTLHLLPNVFFLGSKRYVDMMQYIHSFDLLINPLNVNELTESNYASSIDLALALGKPVVSMQTDPLGVFSQHIHLVNSESDFSNAVTLALKEVSDVAKIEQRKLFAESLSIRFCADRFYAVLDYLEKQRAEKGAATTFGSLSTAPS